MTLWIFLKWKQSILDLTWLKLRIISRILVWLFTIIVCLSPHKVINKSPSGNCGWATSSQFLTKVMKTFRGREEGLEALYGKRIWGLQFSNLQWHKRTHTNIVLKINRCHVGRNVIIYSRLLFSLIFTLVCACSTNSEMLVYKKRDAGLNHITCFAPAQIAVKSSWQFKLAERTKGLLLFGLRFLPVLHNKYVYTIRAHSSFDLRRNIWITRSPHKKPPSMFQKFVVMHRSSCFFVRTASTLTLDTCYSISTLFRAKTAS